MPKHYVCLTFEYHDLITKNTKQVKFQSSFLQHMYLYYYKLVIRFGLENQCQSLQLLRSSKNEILTINIFLILIMFLDHSNWIRCITLMNLNKLMPQEIYGRICQNRGARRWISMQNLQKDISHQGNFDCP